MPAMDQAGTAVVHPLSPASSHSDLSLKDFDLAVKPLPPRPAYGPARDAGSEASLPPLQVANGEPEGLDPVDGDDLDPGSFDLVLPGEQGGVVKGQYELERRSELLFSSRHLQAIFDDPAHLHRFSNFLYRHRPASVPLLVYYLEALKALRAIEYSNAVLRKLEPLTSFDFTHEYFQAQPTANLELQNKADTAFDVLAREELPMYITHVWIQTVTVSIRHKIRGTAAHASEGLAEVFCLTDPSRPDNPIVFMSEEFNKTTQYGVDYVIGRNCRFLQGPHTNPFSVSRIREKLSAGVEHYETFLNYRRDGSPFMNLVMLAPLYDSRGAIRYFIGAQVDVTGLARECYNLGALKRLVDDDDARDSRDSPAPAPAGGRGRDEFTQLAEMLGPGEIETVRDHGGDMHRPAGHGDGWRGAGPAKAEAGGGGGGGDGPHLSGGGPRHRVVLRDPDSPTQSGHWGAAPATAASLAVNHNGRLAGVYENYVLVRPYPSLRILFTSPSMRMPGILQSPLLDRIGGSARMRDQLVQALAEGQGVTAKVRWLSISHKVATYGSRPPRKKMQYNHPLEAHLDADDDADTLAEPETAGRSRWLHCTPLLGSNGKVGVWMVAIVDDEPDCGPGAGAGSGRHSSAGHRRPETAVSDRSAGGAEGSDAAGLPEGRLRIRTRRSSETLGSAAPSAKEPDASATQSIHHQHSSVATRAPAKPGLRGTSVPARFFNSAALSRAAVAGDDEAATGSDSGQQQQQQSQPHSRDGPGGTPKQGEVRSETPLSAWPLPPDSYTHLRRKREHHIYVPPPIQEASSDCGTSRGRNDDGETASTRSRGSAFTVRIEEE